MQYALRLALYACAAGVYALPSRQDALLKEFSVQARYNEDFRMDLPSTLLRICQKYNVSVPQQVTRAVAASRQQDLSKRRTIVARAQEQGEVPAVPYYNDSEYLCSVEVGTPPHQFNLNFDTGSSDLWVYGPEMPPEQMHGQAEYQPRNSSSAQKMEGEVWFAGYIDGGYVGGDVYRDVVAVGGLAVESQGVQVASVAHGGITADGAMDGILGLAFDGLNFARPTRLRTWFSNVVSRLREPLFTVDFRHRDTGKYTFGYVDVSSLTGPVVYSPVDTTAGYWNWTSSGYAIGSGQTATKLRGGNLTGTVDTGTPIMILPTGVGREYYAHLVGARYDEGQGGWIFECGVSLPDFTFGVGDSKRGAVITVPGAYLNAGLADPSAGMDMGNDHGKREGAYCVGGIQSLGDYVVFGAAALKAGVVVFDARMGRERLGWANKTLAV